MNICLGICMLLLFDGFFILDFEFDMCFNIIKLLLYFMLSFICLK